MLVASRISQRMLRYRDSAQACFCTNLVCVGRRKCFDDMFWPTEAICVLQTSSVHISGRSPSAQPALTVRLLSSAHSQCCSHVHT